MGYMTELNTLIGLPNDFDTSILTIGNEYTIIKERERTFPLHIAMLIVDHDWNFYGYGVAHSLFSTNGKSELKFTVLSLFTKEEQQLYKTKFLEAANQTGEIKK